MLNHASVLALSLSLLSLAASPALAQAKSAPAKPAPAPAKPVPAKPAAAPVVVAQATTPQLSAASLAKKTFEFSLMGGYRFMHGIDSTYASRTTANQENIDNAAPGTPPTIDDKRQVSQSIENTPTSNALSTGFSVSGSATYWLDPSFGLGLDYTLVHTGMSIEAMRKLELEPASTHLRDEDNADGTKIENKSQSRFTRVPWIDLTSDNAVKAVGSLAGGDLKEFQVTRLLVDEDWDFVTLSKRGTFLNPEKRNEVGAATNTFINSDKAVAETAAATSPTNEFTAKGKIGGSEAYSTTMHMANALTKTVIGANERGELHLLAGVSIPRLSYRTVSTVSIAGEDGKGAATQTVKHVDVDDTANNFTHVTEIEAKRELDRSTTSTLVGPMIGVGGNFQINEKLRFYGAFGYTPMMIGSRVTASTTTESLKITETYQDVGSSSGKTRGSTVFEDAYREDSGNVYSTAWATAATSFMVGARYSLTDSLGLNIEGLSQNVSDLGYTGINAGLSVAF